MEVVVGGELRKGKERFRVMCIIGEEYQVVVLNGPRQGNILTWKLPKRRLLK